MVCRLALILVFLSLIGCDDQVGFEIKGREGMVEITIPESMLLKNAEYPGKFMSMIMLKVYPQASDRFHNDILTLGNYIDEVKLYKHLLEELKGENRAEFGVSDFEKYYYDYKSGFALVKRSGGKVFYLECAEPINPGTKCSYYGTYRGYVSYQLAVPLKEVAYFDAHLESIESKISEMLNVTK